MKKIPSIPIILLSLLIIGIAPWARRILRFIYGIIGREKSALGLKIIFLVGIALLVIYLLIKRQKIKIGYGIIFPLGSFILLTILFFKIKLPEEKVHLIEYAILGFLLFKDFFKGRIKLFISILFLLIVAFTDELFQLFLPDRYFDFRDIIFNSVGGFAGWIFGNFLLKK